MRQHYLLLTGLILFSFGFAIAQPTQPANPAAGNASNCTTTGSGGVSLDQCPVGSVFFTSNFTGGTYNRGNNGNNLGVGAIWRFTNIGTVGGVPVNVEVTVNSLSNAVMTSMDDNSGLDQANVSVADFFAPVIRPDVSLNASDRRGYVQFTLNFFQGTNNFTTPIVLNSLNFVSYDADGNYNTGGSSSQTWFRETRVSQLYSGGNPTVLAASGSELTAYNYTDPAATTWTGFAGGVYERSGISRCAEVASSFRYGTGVNGRSSITFRFGYDFKAGSGYNVGNPGRQYGAKFGCYAFPNQSTLPVSLKSFTAARNQQSATVNLKWTSSSEINNAGFEVQRNTGNDNWQTIGFVNSQAPGGNSSTEINYYFNDVNPSKFLSQYRLRQVDMDTRIKYSEIRSVRGMDQKTGIIIYPNPTTDGRINILFEEKNLVRDLTVTDMSGRTIKQMKNIAANSVQIDNLNPGMYTLRIFITNTGEQSVEKILVNKR